jgi:hypothetical protein
MTNAVDTLLVGGPANGRMFCLNKNTAGFPHKCVVMSLDEPAGELTYDPAPWWDEATQRWFWIATWEGAPPTQSEIIWMVTVSNFPPAWDMRSKPAPEPEIEE